jgi:hypothetical protein
MNEGAWWRQPRRAFQHLLRERDAIGLKPAELIAEARAMSAEVYLSMGAGFSAWYPTALRSQQVNPHLAGDFLGGVVDAAKRQNMRVIARVDISKGRAAWLARDPQWFVRRPDGSPSLVWDLPQICATGPYWQHEAFAILAELLARFQVDGFFFNYFNVTRCHCARCETIVRAATGESVPAPGTRSPAYERWRQAYLADYLSRLRAFAKARAPSVALIPYHHLRDGWDYRAMARHSDVVSAQCSNPLVANPIDPQPQWAHWGAEEARLARAVKPDAAPLLVHSGSAFFASRQTAIPPDRLVRSMIEAAAHGASAMPAINGRLVQDDARAIPAIDGFMRHLADNARWYRDLGSCARIALIRAQASIDWGPDRGRAAGDPASPGHVAEFRGCFEMLMRLRYPCDVLPDGGLDRESLARYAAVIAPAVSCLDGADAAALDAYVAGGGTLILTADFAAADQDGVALQAPALAAMPHLPGAARHVAGGYLRIADPDLRAALGGIPHVGVDGEMWTPRLGEGDPELDLLLLGPFQNNAPEFTFVEGAGVEPGLIGLTHGKGRVLWLPWRIGALFHVYGVADYAAVFGRLLARAAGAPPVRSDAPASVACVLASHPDGAVLHLINGATMQGKPLSTTTPIAGFEVELSLRAARAIDLAARCELALERRGESVALKINRLDSFAAIALCSKLSDSRVGPHGELVEP